MKAYVRKNALVETLKEKYFNMELNQLYEQANLFINVLNYNLFKDLKESIRNEKNPDHYENKIGLVMKKYIFSAEELDKQFHYCLYKLSLRYGFPINVQFGSPVKIVSIKELIKNHELQNLGLNNDEINNTMVSQLDCEVISEREDSTTGLQEYKIKVPLNKLENAVHLYKFNNHVVSPLITFPLIKLINVRNNIINKVFYTKRGEYEYWYLLQAKENYEFRSDKEYINILNNKFNLLGFENISKPTIVTMISSEGFGIREFDIRLFNAMRWS